jgi:3'(2'), 5'-bisphosphate nucleotidase
VLAATARPEDHEIASRTATAAGELLLRVRHELDGAAWHERGDEGDWQAHQLLMQLLRDECPEDGILSEEGRDDLARLERSRVWIVDPLDGTREFSEHGRSDWAVHVALAIDGTVAAGAVALPALGKTLGTLPAEPMPARAEGPMRIVVSRSRPPQEAYQLARAFDGELLALGSAGAKAMAVVMGHVDVYVHSGGQYEWDNAAPAAVAQAAGLHASRIDGAPLLYNRRDPWLPDLVICRPEIASEVLDVLKAQHR